MEDITYECEVCIPEWCLEEEVYMEEPLDYMRKGEEKKALKLKKALYGLKQAP